MNPYRILKVSPDAPDEVIRAAYKALASKYHPDKNPGDEHAARIMQRVNDAYGLLSDPIKRKEYDRKADSGAPPIDEEEARSTVEKTVIRCKSCERLVRIPPNILSNPQRYKVTCPNCRQNPLVDPESNKNQEPEPSKSIISCQHCGQSIRVISDAILRPEKYESICPSCNKNPIPSAFEPKYYQKPASKPSADISTYFRSFLEAIVAIGKTVIGLALLAWLGTLAFNKLAESGANNTPATTPQARSNPTPPAPPSPSRPQAPVFSQPIQPLPETGDNTASFSDGVAPLTISTSSTGNHYLVKLVKVGSGLEIGSYFIRSGETLSIKVPLGTYEIKYVTGRQWYGLNHLFGPETSYNKAESVFTFSFDGYQYNGYTVELVIQSNGNLRTSRLSPNQW